VWFFSASGKATGVRLSSGSSSWASVSDRDAKEGFAAVDRGRLLETLAAMPVQSWSLRAQNAAMRHIGPVAQDFNGQFAYLFGQVESPLYINTMDAVGVSLAGVQGLYQLSQTQSTRIQQLEAQNAALEQRLAALEAAMIKLLQGQARGER
jgi:hypothetical protein